MAIEDELARMLELRDTRPDDFLAAVLANLGFVAKSYGVAVMIVGMLEAEVTDDSPVTVAIGETPHVSQDELINLARRWLEQMP